MKKTFAFVSLGCDKNRVDGERLLGEIVSHGCDVTSDPNEAEIVIVNTCAFLNSAREEAIGAILDMNGYRKGKLEKIVVSGCLPEGFAGELFPALTEADVLLGINDVSSLFPALERSYARNERVNAVGKGRDELLSERIVTTPEHYKYLKIAEGCSNHCTYCLIPKIRGKYRSYDQEDLLKEAASLGTTQELILVAQDTTRYGEDRGENKFAELIEKISELDNICHIRLLYCYPECIDETLIAEVRDNPKVIKYLDIPLQHSEDRILKLMGRRGTRAQYLELFARLRNEIPDIAVRTTFISGFPTETEEEHRALIAFLKEAKLTNCGFFAYSREEGTPAYRMKGQVHHATKERRVRELYAAQAEVSAEQLQTFVGKTLAVVCDGIDDENQCFIGRAYFQAPDVDGVVRFTAEKAAEGAVYNVKITAADTYDLWGNVSPEEVQS